MNVAMMTSGGLAPCLSSSVAYLIEFWSAALKAGTISGLTIRMYIDGYKGVLTGDSMVLNPELYDDCSCLHDFGGSPIGNSRVKVRNFVCVGGGGLLVYISCCASLI
jgi:pyrophosphate--fructose-6-phosphate 1-phosphotransferase